MQTPRRSKPADDNNVCHTVCSVTKGPFSAWDLEKMPISRISDTAYNCYGWFSDFNIWNFRRLRVPVSPFMLPWKTQLTQLGPNLEAFLPMMTWLPFQNLLMCSHVVWLREGPKIIGDSDNFWATPCFFNQ